MKQTNNSDENFYRKKEKEKKNSCFDSDSGIEEVIL